jgi:hypothetical protein
VASSSVFLSNDPGTELIFYQDVTLVVDHGHCAERRNRSDRHCENLRKETVQIEEHPSEYKNNILQPSIPTLAAFVKDN